MDGMNKVYIMGNLGADPELRIVAGGQSVLKMRVATSERFTDKDKQVQERTEWHRVTVWGRRAEGLAKILRKGARIVVEGRLHTSSYDKDGQKHYSTEIVALDVFLAGGSPARTSTGYELGDASLDAAMPPPSAANGALPRPTLPQVPF